MKDVVKRAPSGLLVLTEDYMDLSALADDHIRALRQIMTDKATQERADFNALGDDRYCSPEGAAEMRDMNYYDECLRRIESEMAARMLTLSDD